MKQFFMLVGLITLLAMSVAGYGRWAKDSAVKECLIRTDAATDSECEWCEEVTTPKHRKIIKLIQVDSVFSIMYVERTNERIDTIAMDYISKYQLSLLKKYSIPL